jgi:hypothetical protein
LGEWGLARKVRYMFLQSLRESALYESVLYIYVRTILCLGGMPALQHNRAVA